MRFDAIKIKDNVAKIATEKNGKQICTCGNPTRSNGTSLPQSLCFLQSLQIFIRAIPKVFLRRVSHSPIRNEMYVPGM